MITPQNYRGNLSKGIITPEMISDVLFSYSKRAKNYRDSLRKINDRFPLYRDFYVEQREKQMCEMYEKKDFILQHFATPDCIHTIKQKRKERIYDYEEEFYEVDEKDILRTNYYFDRDTNEIVNFVDVLRVYPTYFLFYALPGHSFHSPVERHELKKYPLLEIVELKELVTYGEDINELLSKQFCDKVFELLTKKIV